uniref:mucin-17-like n=1 Tax=Styela clava TaxID=7725 RepID=UPI001939AFC7|nr:mucin-17-like [Styela clava]
MDYYYEDDSDERSTTSTQISQTGENYSYDSQRSVPKSPRFQALGNSSRRSSGNISNSYHPSPYGWQPPNMSRQQSNTSELESLPSDFGTEFSDGFMYVDPDLAYSKVEETVPGNLDNKGVKAKDVCRQISKLLRDKDSPSRGSRMFQKRRKRAHKFTTVGYGTQPPDENKAQVVYNDDTSSSEELSRLDYTTDDEEIAAYDKPGVHNVLTSSTHLNPSDQLIQKQLRNLAMDASGMRGKGAKIFAKRQQRMENYVITDENRKQVRNRSASTDRELPPRAPRDYSQGSYVRPGSSIAITPKPMYNKVPVNFNRGQSGYSTDVEDDYRSFSKPQVNYFSDCEGIAPERQSRSRRTRPINRRAWEDDNRQESDYSLNNVYTAQSMNNSIQRPPNPGYVSGGEESQSRSPFRRVLPPGRSPLMSPSRGSRESSLTRNCSLSPARPELSVEESSTPRRNWSRVTFNPRKITSQPVPTPSSVVDYPCNRTHAAQSKPLIAKNLVSRAPSNSPQRQHPTQTATYSRPPMPKTTPQAALPIPQPPKVPMQQQPRVSQKPLAANPNNATASSSKNNLDLTAYKPSSAVSLLEKPMARKIKTTAHLTPNKFADDVPPSDNDFIGNTEINLSDIVSSIKNEMPEASENNPEKDSFEEQDNAAPTNGVKEEDNVRGSSPASVLSYVSSNSNSSTFTSMLPSRCLTPPARPFTPNGSRSVKIVSKYSTLEKPASIVTHNTVSVDTVTTEAPIKAPLVSSSFAKQKEDQPPKGDKISACMKVLDPSKMLFKPKPPVQYQPSPTLNAILQSESEKSYGNMKTPPMSYEYPCKKVTEVESPLPVPKPATKQQSAYSYHPPPSPSTKKRYSPPGQEALPLGMIAEGMKGKGAKMFEKQLKRMQQYTKETTHDDFPELSSPQPNESANSPTPSGRFTYQPLRMAGFSPTGKKLEPGKEVKNGMRDVMGEFKNGSKPGKAKRPSETKKKGRDPLYYQQQLFYRPPSADDFVEPPPEVMESQSDASSVTSSKTNTSSLSSFNTDRTSTDALLTPQQHDNTTLSSPTASTSSLSGNIRSTNSSSSISSQKSVGPKTAPKPSRALITRQLSKPNSPPPSDLVVSTSPTPEIQTFIPTSPAKTDEDSAFVFQGTEEKDLKCIENLIERMPDDHRCDGSIVDETRSRRRVLSIDQTNGHSNDTEQSLGYAPEFQPPSYDDVISSAGEPEVKRSGGFAVSKPKFNIKKSGVPVQMWKPGQ